MVETKYGQYVKTLTFDHEGHGLYRQVTSVSGAEFGLDFHVRYGAYWAAGKMGVESHGAHVHDFDQVMVWMGGDTTDMGELGAEVELLLGREPEKYMVTSSTAISVPKGTPHFPATINRMDKRFIYMEVSCAAEYKETSAAFEYEEIENIQMAGFNAKHREKVINMAFMRKGAWTYGPKNRDDAGGSLAFVANRDHSFDFLIMIESLKKAPYRFGPFRINHMPIPYPKFSFSLVLI